MNRSKKAGERILLRPSGGAAWEVWSLEGSQPRSLGASDTPAGAQPSPQSVLALPLRQLFAVPLWLSTTDPALMRGMIHLQLERRGVAAGRNGHGMVFDYRVVTTADNKTLALAVALPAALPPPLCLDLRDYEPSARLLPLPPDQFTIWREEGRLVLAATRGSGLVYFQALGDSEFTAPVLQELQCIKLQLEAGNTIGNLCGVTLWGDFTPASAAAPGEALGLRVATAPQPAPVLPADPMDLVPAPVRRTQEVAKNRGRYFAIASMAAGVYFLFLLFLVARVAWFSIEAGRVAADLGSHAGEVARIKATAARWQALSPALEPDTYPVELLLRCSRPLAPDGGVRFTLFSTGAGTILIQGEAANAAPAFKYAEDLRKSDELRDYKFEMPLPATLPNGNTKFQIQGVRYGASAH